MIKKEIDYDLYVLENEDPNLKGILDSMRFLEMEAHNSGFQDIALLLRSFLDKNDNPLSENCVSLQSSKQQAIQLKLKEILSLSVKCASLSQDILKVGLSELEKIDNNKVEQL